MLQCNFTNGVTTCSSELHLAMVMHQSMCKLKYNRPCFFGQVLGMTLEGCGELLRLCVSVYVCVTKKTYYLLLCKPFQVHVVCVASVEWRERGECDLCCR